MKLVATTLEHVDAARAEINEAWEAGEVKLQEAGAVDAALGAVAWMLNRLLTEPAPARDRRVRRLEPVPDDQPTRLLPSRRGRSRGPGS